jgi:agmatinase
VYAPPDALEAPRFTGPRTFARLPYTDDIESVAAAVFGMPWDGATSFRSGARFGPEAVRSMSGMIRTYNPEAGVQVFGDLSMIDYGDCPTIPGYVEDTLTAIAEFVRPLAEGSVAGIGIGGDHSCTLGELRAYAHVHGPLGLVHLDSHTDLGESYFAHPLSHGTMFRRAVEEGVIDPGRTIQAGMRGSVYDKGDREIPAALGVDMVPWSQLREMGPAAHADRVRARVGTGPAFLSFDIDFVDPAFCPGTGTPEVGGPTSWEALQYVRALTGINFVSGDVVEVAPQYDHTGQVTALMAANVMFEMLTLVVLQHRRLVATDQPLPT